MATAPSAPAKLATGTVETPAKASDTGNVIDSIAPSAAPGRHAQRERRGERVAEQRLEDDARRGERRAHEGGRQRSRQPGDEEDLRVGVVRERDAAVEHAPQRNRDGADHRRHQACRRGQEAEHQNGEQDAASQRHAAIPPCLSGEAAPRSGGRRRRGSGRPPRRRRAPAPTRASAPGRWAPPPARAPCGAGSGGGTSRPPG